MPSGHEIQPSLPLFPDYSVYYEQLQPMLHEDFATGLTSSKIIELPVDEIDLLRDGKLREALWNKHAKNYTQAPNSYSVFAFDDDTFSHVISTPRRPLSFPVDHPFTAAESVSTSETNDPEHNVAAAKPRTDMLLPITSLIRRILDR
jgi:hypothetical protein